MVLMAPLFLCSPGLVVQPHLLPSMGLAPAYLKGGASRNTVMAIANEAKDFSWAAPRLALLAMAGTCGANVRLALMAPQLSLCSSHAPIVAGYAPDAPTAT